MIDIQAFSCVECSTKNLKKYFAMLHKFDEPVSHFRLLVYCRFCAIDLGFMEVFDKEYKRISE